VVYHELDKDYSEKIYEDNRVEYIPFLWITEFTAMVIFLKKNQKTGILI
jgi:hypothetical protein